MPPPEICVVISRPFVRPAIAHGDLQRKDFCWTADGEILAPPPLACADVDTCGCAWAFCGVTSARATTWGVVEARRRAEAWEEVRSGRHVAGNAIVEGFAELTFDEILQISARVASLPIGTVVGIWTLDDDHYSLFDRTPRHFSPVSNATS